jgi:hypothetical protein
MLPWIHKVRPQYKVGPQYIKGTIIIVAVYINGSENSFNELVKCLKQLRHIYTHETIIAVDNTSINNTWYSVANELGIIIIHNDSKDHRFEAGAYRYALKHFRADNYIFIQGTFFINKRIEYTLSSTEIDMVSFQHQSFDFWYDGVALIKALTDKIGFYPKRSEIGVLIACSFYANGLFVNKLIELGVFELECNTKAHSCAFERVLYIVTKNILGDFTSIPKEYWHKTYLNQDPIILQ